MNCITKLHMSYSNGKLPEDTFSHEKIIEIVKGLPGVGFKLTDDGDYDIQNKKLRNVASPETNNDVTTKSYVDNKALLVDGSNKMLGALNMDNRRVENVAPARHGQSDAVSSLHLHNFYFDLNTNDGKIEAQNPIDMKDEKISNLAEGTDNSDAITKHQLETGLAPKADKTELSNYLKKDGSIALANNLDLGDNKIVNVKEATSGTDAVNFTQLNNELYKYLHESGGDMTGDIRMNNNSIYGIGNVENDTSAVNRKYVNDELNKKLDKNKDFSMGNNKITSLRNPDDSNELVNKSYVDRKVSQAGGSVDLTPYLKRDGTVSVTGNLNMSLNKIINCGQPTGARDVTNKAYVDSEVGKTLKLDGSGVMTSVLDMNNQRIINLGNATHNQDAITLKQVNDGIATVSTENNRYTDEQIEKNKKYVDDEMAKSHITTHTNRKNVLKYAMDDGEFTEDYGIQDANLIDYNDSPHTNNKKAFSFNVQKAKDGSSQFKGRFDFNLFKLIRDDYSDKYTVCLEIYFPKTGFDLEFGSLKVTLEKTNMNTIRTTTVKTNTDYKYYRFIMNLSPDGSSPNIERRLYVTVQSTYDNRSPTLLPLYVLIYGIKGEAKNNLDFTIYDYEKAYEVVNDQFQMHVPIDMNGNKISGLSNKILPSYAYGTTLESSLGCDFNISRTVHLTFTKIYIDKIKIYAKKNYPSESNHDITFYGDKSVFYDIDFSTSKILTVNINRYFENISNIRINFDDDDGDGVRSYVYIIHYKTLLID